MRRAAPWLLWLGACWALAGCTPSGPATIPVSGTVTWDGKPLPTGDIVFLAADGHGVPDHGRIKDGKYQLNVKPGTKRIEVYAERELEEQDPVMGQAPRQQYIPSKYNTATQLRAKVHSDKDNVLDFSLTREVKSP